MFMKKLTAVLLLFIMTAANITMAKAKEIAVGNPAGYYDRNLIRLPGNTEVELKGDHTLLFINGTLTTDYEVIIRNDRALIPIRLISDALPNTSVEWDERAKTVTIRDDHNTIILTIDQNTALLNDKSTRLDYPAIMYNNETYVPLRFVFENIDTTVDYAPQMGSVHKSYYNTAIPLTPQGTVVRDFPNITIDEKYTGVNYVSEADAMNDAKETCMTGLDNFTKTIKGGSTKSDVSAVELDNDLSNIAYEINRMYYIGQVSRYYQFTIGPYDILYDKYDKTKFFIVYSPAVTIKKIDVNDPELFLPGFVNK